MKATAPSAFLAPRGMLRTSESIRAAGCLLAVGTAAGIQFKVGVFSSRRTSQSPSNTMATFPDRKGSGSFCPMGLTGLENVSRFHRFRKEEIHSYDLMFAGLRGVNLFCSLIHEPPKNHGQECGHQPGYVGTNPIVLVVSNSSSPASNSDKSLVISPSKRVAFNASWFTYNVTMSAETGTPYSFPAYRHSSRNLSSKLERERSEASTGLFRATSAP